MINEIVLEYGGTKHTFEITQNGMDIVFTSGKYEVDGNDFFTTETGVTLSFNTPLEDTHYELWLNDTGLVVLTRTDGEFAEVTNPIDRLAWFTIPAGAISLDDVEINVIRMEVI
jgi:hypothetical protein